MSGPRSFPARRGGVVYKSPGSQHLLSERSFIPDATPWASRPGTEWMSDTSGNDPWESLSALPTGRRVELSDGHGHSWTGTVVPRHDFSGDRVLQLKLESGYNIGVRIEPNFEFKVLGSSEHPASRPLRAAPPSSQREGDSWVALLTTGG